MDQTTRTRSVILRHRAYQPPDTDHLNQNASEHSQPKEICRSVGQLIIPCKRQLQGDSESLSQVQSRIPISRLLVHLLLETSAHLDGHDGHASDERTDGQVDHGILRAVFGYDLDDHVRREDPHGEKVKQEA